MPDIEFQRAVEQTTLTLTQHEGSSIKEYIKELAPCKLPVYFEQIGLNPGNCYSILQGKRRCTLDMLNTLLSGISASVRLEMKLVIQLPDVGPAVLDAGYTEQGGMSLLADTDQWDLDEFGFSSLEKLPEKPKTLKDSPSSEGQV